MYLILNIQSYYLLKGPKTNKISFKISTLKIKKKTFKITNPESHKIKREVTSIPVTVKVKIPANNDQAAPGINSNPMMKTFFVLLAK